MKDVKEHYDVAVIPKEAIDIDYPKGKYCNANFPDPLMRMTRYLPMTKDLVDSEHGYLSQLQHFIVDTSK